MSVLSAVGPAVVVDDVDDDCPIGWLVGCDWNGLDIKRVAEKLRILSTLMDY